VLFAVFRAVLYFIEHLMDQSVNEAEGVSGHPPEGHAGKSRKRWWTRFSSRLQRSIGLWWRARTLAIHSAPAIDPGGNLLPAWVIASLVIFFVAFR